MFRVRYLMFSFTLCLALLIAPLTAKPTLAQAPAADGAIGTVIGDLLGDIGLKTGTSGVGGVADIAYDSTRNRVYVAGSFTTALNGATESVACGVASLKPDGSWDSSFAIVAGTNDTCSSYRVMVDGNYLYVGTGFGGSPTASDPDGDADNSLVYRVNLTTNRIDRSWLPTIPGDYQTVTSLAALPGSGGKTIAVGLQSSPYFILIDGNDASSVTTVPDVDARVNTLYLDGSTLYVGGNFTTAPAYLRKYSWSGSALTVDAGWSPLAGVTGISLNNIYRMTGNSSHLYLHGSSSGDWRGPWRIPLSGTGANTPDTGWRPNISKSVDGLVLDDNWLYILGEINEPYNSMIRYDLSTDPPTLDTNLRAESGPVAINALSLYGGDGDRFYDGAVLPAGNGLPRRIVVAGSFESLNGIVNPSIGMITVEGAAMPTRPSISGVSGSGRGPYTINGSAQAGMQIVVSDAAAELGTATVNGSGTWSFTTSDNLAIGGHSFTAVARYPHRAGRVLRSDSARSNAKSVAVTVTPAPANRETAAIVPYGDFPYVCENPIDGDNNNCNSVLTMSASGSGAAADGAYPPQHRPDLTAADLTNSRTITVTKLPAQFASLAIRVLDADWPTGEMGKVYLNDRLLGTITGSDNNWSTTVFDIPDLDLIRSGANQIRFGTSFYGNPFDDNYITIVASAVLLIDGGEREHAEITSVDVPEPSGSIVTSNVSQIKSADGRFISTAGLLNPDGQIVAEVNESQELSSGDSPYSWAPATLESSSDDYIGWTVRHSLHAWDAGLKSYVLQDQHDTTYTGLELSIVDGQIVATVTPHLWLRTIATGTVTFSIDGTELGTAELGLDGTARFDLGDLPTGVYDFSAVYSGDDNFWSADAADNLNTTAPPAKEEEAAIVPRCEQLPDMAVSPQFITITPGGTAEVEIALRNLCNDAVFGPADVLLSLSDGLTVTAVSSGWLNLGQRAAGQQISLQPGETVRYVTTVSAGPTLATAPVHITELYAFGAAAKRIDGVFLPTEGMVIGAPQAAAEAPAVVPDAPAAPTEPPTLPATLPNTAAASDKLPWLLLITGVALMLLGLHKRRRIR